MPEHIHGGHIHAEKQDRADHGGHDLFAHADVPVDVEEGQGEKCESAAEKCGKTLGAAGVVSAEEELGKEGDEVELLLQLKAGVGELQLAQREGEIGGAQRIFRAVRLFCYVL